jgi:hypothetical protein
MDKSYAKDFEPFVHDLQSVSAERVDELRTQRSTNPPKAFLDSEKVVVSWPDLSGLIIEEFR